MKPARIVAIDPGLRLTGIAVLDTVEYPGCPPHLRSASSGRIKNPVARLLHWYEHFRKLFLMSAPDLVLIEGYAYARPYQAHQMGELGGVLRLTLAEFGYPFIVVAPGTLKKFATGNGNAGKDQMLSTAVRKLDYEGHDHNDADALWLLEMAMVHYGIEIGISTPPRRTEIPAGGSRQDRLASIGPV